MAYLDRKTLLNILKLLDLFAAALCLLLAAAVVAQNIPDVSFEQFLSMRVKVSNLLLVGIFMVVWHVILAEFGLYQSMRFPSLQSEAIEILKATSLGTGLLLMASVIVPISMIDTQFLVVYWTSISTFMFLGRLFFRSIMNKVWLTERSRREVVIIGANDRSLRLAKKIEADPDLGYRFKGFIDDQPTLDTGNPEAAQYPLLAGLNDFRSFLNKHPIDEVIICLPMKSRYAEAMHIIALCEKQGVIVRMLPDLFRLERGLPRVDSLGSLPMIAITTATQESRLMVSKRILDLVGSILLLIFLFPVLLATALLIKAASPGPVFFVQERLGQNKRLFRIYKFRTMTQGADQMQKDFEHLNEVNGPAFKIKNDPRITPLGAFLRKTSIDELPQLFNVLRGEMSLVGPRPLPVRDYLNFEEDWHRRRFSVKPGITCLWQVGGRSDLDFEQWMELDMTYIDNWSLWLDMKILLQTIPAVLQRRGAA